MSKNNIEQLKNNLKKSSPDMYSVFEQGFFPIKCQRKSDIEQIESVVKMYLHSKNIHLTPRVIELLTMFVKYDTSTDSRKKISRQINMSRVAINQNVMALKKAELIIYPYDDTKKSVIHNDLLILKKYITKPGKTNILIRYTDEQQ